MRLKRDINGDAINHPQITILISGIKQFPNW